MGIYTKYLDNFKGFPEITQERKRLLKVISQLRGDSDVLVYASTPVGSIEVDDKLAFYDQLSNLGKSRKIDIILETMGGVAEVVEDFVLTLREKYDSIGVIVPGSAMSAGTIFAMGANEILMGDMSTLGPIDAQMLVNGKRFAADAFIKGLDKIKEDCASSGRLNPAYIPILQQISPGEIQACNNAQNFSKSLVEEWLSAYKFQDWKVHSHNGETVTQEDRKVRAREIAEELCEHSKWLTHGRNLKAFELEKMGLKITNYSKNQALNEAITGYYSLLRMTFEKTNIYKVFETADSQIYKFMNQLQNPIPQRIPGGLGLPMLPQHSNVADIEIPCPHCNTTIKVQANLDKPKPIKPGFLPYPVKTNKIQCQKCGTEIDVSQIRMQIEAQSRKKIV